MRKVLWIAVLVVSLLFCLAPTQAPATTLLIDQETPYLGYGYGLSSWGGMTTALNNSFGVGNITVSGSDLNNLSYLMGFDRLWLTARQPYGQTLSATEISNIEAFIVTGRRVVLIGENSAWTAWNNSILQTVGGSYSGNDTSDILTALLSNQLTAGVGTLNTTADGLAVGGAPLFNENVATLWGGSQNVLSLLSVNVIQDGMGTGNLQFDVNTANWLAGQSTQVPEPATLLLLGLGIIGIAGVRRKLQK
jgi:PEP-CTERM motif